MSFEDAIYVDVTPNHRVGVQMVIKGKDQGVVEIAPAIVSDMVARLLTSSKKSAAALGRGVNLRAATFVAGSSVEAGEIGLLPGVDPNFESMAFAFGESNLIVKIPRHALAALGKALLDLSEKK